MPLIPHTCTKCLRDLSPSQFSKRKNGLQYQCKECSAVSSGAYNKKRFLDPRTRLWQSSKINATNRRREHTITPADITLPGTCKYLGIAIDYRQAAERGRLRSWNAASIDRIDPSKGYVPGNIQVISDLANRMKQDATVQQLIAFAEGTLRVHGQQ